MGGKLIANTVLPNPEGGDPVVLAAGEEVPDWASPLVGEHLIEVPTPAPRRATKSD